MTDRAAAWDVPGQVLVGGTMIVAAFLAATSRGRLKAVILVGVTGYGTALMFLLHGPPDLALTQILVETVTLVVAVAIAALAMEAALNEHTTTIPIMLVLSLLGFAGSLSMARFVADRDAARKWDVPTSAPKHTERRREGT